MRTARDAEILSGHESILLVEQNATLALEVSSFAYVLETGTVVMKGESKALRYDPQLKATYLGG